MSEKCFIELKTVEEFPYRSSFTIGDDFFLDEDKSDIEGGELRVDVDAKSLGDDFLVGIKIKGSLKVICDRCLGIVEIPVKSECELRVKDFDGSVSDDEDLIYLQPSETGIDISWTIYEMALLALPAHKVHKDGECDKNMMNILEGYEIKEQSDDKQSDPRWEALKQLKINN